MDLLRLALERAATADAAVSVIVELLERHGQGGPCSHERPGFTYDNSFLVVDPNGAVVLETAGREWAVERVTGPGRSISNGLTIPMFAKAHGNPARTWVASASTRRRATQTSAGGATGPGDLMEALRGHGAAGGPRAGPSSTVAWLRPVSTAAALLASSQTTVVVGVGPA